MNLCIGGLALVLIVTCGACGEGESKADGGNSPIDSAEAFSFVRDLAPVFERNCSLCHHATSAIGYDFTSIFDPDKGIVMRENSWFPNGSLYEFVVVPGKPEESSIVAKVSDADLVHDTDGDPMPLAIDYLTQTQLLSIETWIEDGANNDTFFVDNVAPIFGTEVSLRRVSGKCTWCHYPGSPTGMSVLDVFDPDTGMVNAQSNSGGTIVIPGDPENSVLMTRLRGNKGGAQMPLHLPRLSDEEVQVMKEWITEGAPNN